MRYDAHVRNAVCLLISLSFLYFENTKVGAQEIDGGSVLQAVFLNCEAVFSYDVRIVEEFFQIPRPADKERFVGAEINRAHRIMFDYKRKLLFYCFRETYTQDGSKSPHELREIHAYLGGEPIGGWGGKYPRAEFEGFIANCKVPLVEFAGFGFPLTSKGTTRTELIQTKQAELATWDVQLAPKNTMVFSKVWGANDMYTSRTVIDLKRMVPSIAYINTKEGETVAKNATKYEDADGIFRAVQIDSERESFAGRDANGKALPIKEVGTVAFQWLKFNADDINFPKRESLKKTSQVIDPFLENLDKK